MSGATHDLTEAFIVNSFEPYYVASALHLAPSMPVLQCRAPHSVLRRKIRCASAQANRSRFLEALWEQHNFRVSV